MPEDDDCPPARPLARLPYRPLRRIRPAAASPIGVTGAVALPRATDEFGWLALLELVFADRERGQGSR